MQVKIPALELPSCCAKARKQRRFGVDITGGDYETIYLPSLTLRTPDKDCPGGKKSSLRDH
jgi:hypothetical protein